MKEAESWRNIRNRRISATHRRVMIGSMGGVLIDHKFQVKSPIGTIFFELVGIYVICEHVELFKLMDYVILKIRD